MVRPTNANMDLRDFRFEMGVLSKAQKHESCHFALEVDENGICAVVDQITPGRLEIFDICHLDWIRYVVRKLSCSRSVPMCKNTNARCDKSLLHNSLPDVLQQD